MVNGLDQILNTNFSLAIPAVKKKKKFKHFPCVLTDLQSYSFGCFHMLAALLLDTDTCSNRQTDWQADRQNTQQLLLCTKLGHTEKKLCYK